VIKLHRSDRVPPAVLDCTAKELHAYLPGPVLFELAGSAGAPLFISVLLHGNEHTGLEAMQVLLKRYGDSLPRPVLLFVGNIAAAAANVRTLLTQHDYNRVWPGTGHTQAPEAALMREVVEIVRVHEPFASLDVHNNTGLNPHYACVNRLDERYLHLARLFSRTVVYFTQPRGVQSLALAALCPAVTVECGKVGLKAGTEHAVDFIDACMHLHQWPVHAVPAHDLDLLQTTLRVSVPPEISFSFDGKPAEIRFRPDLERLNFSELSAGEILGHVSGAGRDALVVQSDGGFAEDIDVFDYANGTIRLRRPCVPAMLTRDRNAIRLDCLCYLMRRIDRNGQPQH
jgi:hypothetical protein